MIKGILPIVLIVAVIFGYLLYNNMQKVSEGEEFAKEFLIKLTNNRPEQAHKMMYKGFAKALPLDSLKESYSDNLGAYKNIKWQDTTYSDGEYILKGMAYTNSGCKSNYTAKIMDTDEGLKIYIFTLEPYC